MLNCESVEGERREREREKDGGIEGERLQPPSLSVCVSRTVLYTQ